MTDTERAALAALLRDGRARLNLSAREVARRAGVDNVTVMNLERCRVDQPHIDTLRGLASALEIPLADIYAAIDWLPEAALPSLRPYMRAKYDNLPDTAVAEVEAFIEQLSQQHHHGPIAGEDELPEA